MMPKGRNARHSLCIPSPLRQDQRSRRVSTGHHPNDQADDCRRSSARLPQRRSLSSPRPQRDRRCHAAIRRCRMSPPQRERPAPPQSRPSREHTRCADSTSYVEQLHRRRTASRRLPRLESGRPDPWHYPAPTAGGYRDAAHHLAAHGLTPAPNVAALRDMWKAGGESRRVAAVISDRWLA